MPHFNELPWSTIFIIGLSLIAILAMGAFIGGTILRKRKADRERRLPDYLHKLNRPKTWELARKKDSEFARELRERPDYAVGFQGWKEGE